MTDIQKIDVNEEQHERPMPTDYQNHGKSEETRGFALQRTEGDVEPEIHFVTWIVLAALAFQSFSLNVATTGAGFWAGSVVGSFGHPEIAIFFATGWLVTQVGMTPICGLMCDFGPLSRKYLCVGLALWGAMGLFVAASAKNMYIGIMGICLFGPAEVTLGVQAAIAADIFPRRFRGMAAGTIYTGNAMGALFASVAGGAFIKDNVGGTGDGWRWNLYIAGICLATSAGVILFAYRPIKHPELDTTPYMSRVARLDWLGAILFAGGMVPFLLALEWGGNKYPWHSTSVISCFSIAAVFYLLFFAHQIWFKKDGILNHRLFKNRNFAISIFAITIEGVVYITLNTFLGSQISTIYEQRPIYIGLHFAILLIFASLFALLWGWFSNRYRHVKYPLIFSYFLFIGACIGFSQATPSSNTLVYVMCAMVGAGFGGPLALILATAQLAVDPDLTGITSNLVIGLRSWGALTGTSIASAVFSSTISKQLPMKIAEYATNAGVSETKLPSVIAAVAGAGGMPVSVEGVTNTQMAAAQLGRLVGYSKCYSYIYYEMLPWAALAAIALFFLKDVTDSMDWSITTAVESYDKLGVKRMYGDDEAHELAARQL